MNVILIIILILVLMLFITYNTDYKCTKNCNVYNHLDFKSICDNICNKDDKVFGGNYTSNECECTDKIKLNTIDEHLADSSTANKVIANIEHFTNERDDTEQLNQQRYNDLIFGFSCKN